MKRKVVSISIAIAAIAMLFAMVSFATVPPPVVNQNTGIDDGVFNNLVEEQCRVCHEDPDIVDPGTIPDRHHLLVGGTLDDPESAPFGVPGGEITCYVCHDVDCSTGVCDINVYRDCLFCHQQIAGDASVHHLTATATGGDCVACHGDIVDNMDDGHTIPTYDPSVVTPKPSGGLGPQNPSFTAVTRGACDYCHTTGNLCPPDGSGEPECPVGEPDPLNPGIDLMTGILVYGNSATHHNTGFGLDLTKCDWCHYVSPPTPALIIRTCEGCHGFDSLHNIQIDSNGGGIDPGNELAYYGHIGNNDDCLGCHGGYETATAPGTGPITPSISSIDPLVVEAGTNTAVTLTGNAFTNTVGTYVWSSNVVLTAADGSTTVLIPDSISDTLIIVTIPATMATGNYEVRAVKDNGTVSAESNAVVISIIPDAVITEVKCIITSDGPTLIIKGSGFGDSVPEAAAYTTIQLNRTTLTADNITVWRDDLIKADVGICPSRGKVKITTVFGDSDTGRYKNPKPKKPR